MGLLLLAAAVPLEPLLSLPVALLRAIGAISFVYAVYVTLVARREHLSTGAARFIVFGNVVWVVASVGLLLSGWVSPTPLGYTFVTAQAVAVALLAELQFVGLDQLDRPAPFGADFPKIHPTGHVHRECDFPPVRRPRRVCHPSRVVEIVDWDGARFRT